MHGQAKRGPTQIKQGPLKRTASVALSPPKKKTIYLDSNDSLVKGLENKNENLTATVKTKQDLINNQANIIGDLREQIYGLEIKIEEKTQENEVSFGHLIEMDKVNQGRLNDLKKIISKKEMIITNIEQESKYFKSENDKANRDIAKLNNVYQTHVLEMKETGHRQDNEIKMLKDKLVRQGLEKSVTKEKTNVVTEQRAQKEVQQRAMGEAGEEAQEQARRTPQQELVREEVAQEGASQEVAPQEAPKGVNPGNQIWRPPGHPPVNVDECVENVRCEGNCEHVKCPTETTSIEK